MRTEIEIKDGRLSLPMESIIAAMSMEQKREVLAWLATDFEVMTAVVNHICGDDEFGWSTGDPSERVKILQRIEETQLSESVRYNWKPWEELRQKVKDIRSTEHLYWVLYHKIDPDVSRRVFEELRRLGVESNYTTKECDDDVAAIKDAIDAAFKAMQPATL